MLHNVLRNKYTTIFRGLKTPDKSGVRDYIHVEDICDAFQKAIKKYMTKKMIIDLFFKFLILVQLEEIAHKKLFIRQGKIIKDKTFKIHDGKKRLGDQSIVVCNYKKAKNI